MQKDLKMKVFLTGARGFISQSILSLAPSAWDIMCSDVKEGADLTRDLATLSVNDIPEDTKLILHIGAVVDTRCVNAKQLQEVNVEPNNVFCEFMAKHSDCRLVFASSAATYGKLKAPNHVKGPTSPENLYGQSKLDAEVVLLEQKLDSIRERCVCLRFFNVYGPGEQHKDVMASMLFQLSRDMIIHKKNMVSLFKYGEQKRDFIHVLDVAQAVIDAAHHKNKPGTVSVFNVGSGTATSFNTVLRLLIEGWRKTDIMPSDHKQQTEYIDCPYEFFQPHTEAVMSDEFKWRPKLSIEEGAASYVKYLAELWALPPNYERNQDGVIHYIPGPMISYDPAYIESYTKLPLASEMSFLRLGALMSALAAAGATLESVLDVGYGDGAFLKAALKTSALCSGTDISGYNVPAGAIQVRPDEWQTKPFTVITFFDSLEHFPDIEFIQKLNCKFIFISLPNCHYRDQDWFRGWKHRKPGEHIFHFNEYTLENFFNRMGFVAVSPSLWHEDVIRAYSQQVEPNILCRLFKNTRSMVV